jgi:undecaprenyl diphosphate synthase
LVPKHIAIIMDGNGRWAHSRRKPRIYGHIKGARVAKTIITEAADLGLQYLTLYAFSTENWQRPQAEVAFLMKLLHRYLFKETENLVKKNIRFQTIGDLTKLPAGVQNQVQAAKEKTKNNSGLNLIFAINYGARQEIINAAKKMIEQAQLGKLSAEAVDEATINNQLETHQIPDPDLIIRTSGEARLSNFLLWQAAYSELYFTQTLWPDFTIKDFHAALNNFSQRQRRFGSISTYENIFN